MSGFRRHLLDISGSTIASLTATAADGLAYAALVHTLVAWQVMSIGLAAGLGALIGGVIHYSMCRFWVFRRFETSLGWSVATYFAMSGLAAVGHGFLTAWLADYLGAGFGWGLSKAAIWAFWTYPASRYIVFGATRGTPDKPGDPAEEETFDADPR